VLGGVRIGGLAGGRAATPIGVADEARCTIAVRAAEIADEAGARHRARAVATPAGYRRYGEAREALDEDVTRAGGVPRQSGGGVDGRTRIVADCIGRHARCVVRTGHNAVGEPRIDAIALELAGSIASGATDVLLADAIAVYPGAKRIGRRVLDAHCLGGCRLDACRPRRRTILQFVPVVRVVGSGVFAVSPAAKLRAVARAPGRAVRAALVVTTRDDDQPDGDHCHPRARPHRHGSQLSTAVNGTSSSSPEELQGGRRGAAQAQLNRSDGQTFAEDLKLLESPHDDDGATPSL